MKTGLILLFAFLLNVAHGQGFSKVIDNPYNEYNDITGSDLIIIGDTMFVYGLLHYPNDSVDYFANNYIAKLNLDGDLIDFKRFEAEEFWTYNPGKNCGDITGNYIVNTYAKLIPQGEYKLIINKIDHNLNTVSEIEVQMESDNHVPNQIKVLQDNNYIISGRYSDANFAGFYLKVDSLGNVLWNHGSSQLHEVYQAIQDSDGNIFVAASIKTGIPGNSAKPILRKITNDGFVAWNYIYGGYWGPYISDVLINTDGHLVVASIFGVQLGQNFSGKIEIKIIEDLGTNRQLLNYQQYGNPHVWDKSIHRIKQTDDGGYLIAGMHQEAYLFQSIRAGFVQKVNANLDSLWSRTYSHYYTNLALDQFNDMEINENGEIFLVGRTRNGPTTANSAFDTWIVKLDEWGCIEPGCQLVGTEEIIIGLENSLQVYPNPSKDFVQVKITTPELFNSPLKSELKLLNSSGVIVQTISISKSQLTNTITIDINHLPPGFYVLHWTNNDVWYDSIKIVKN